MNINNDQKGKYKIALVAFFGISIILALLQQPVLNYLILVGKEVDRNYSTSIVNYLIMVARAALICLSVFLTKQKKVATWLFSIAIGISVVLQVFSIASTAEVIAAYSNYNAGMEWVKPVLSQLYISQSINIAYLLIHSFLFVDAVMRHKFIKITKIINLVLLGLALVSTVGNFAANSILYAITLTSGLFSSAAMATYYWFIAQNNHALSLEDELKKLKEQFNNNEITADDYAAKKEAVLRRL